MFLVLKHKKLPGHNQNDLSFAKSIFSTSFHNPDFWSALGSFSLETETIVRGIGILVCKWLMVGLDSRLAVYMRCQFLEHSETSACQRLKKTHP